MLDDVGDKIELLRSGFGPHPFPFAPAKYSKSPPVGYVDPNNREGGFGYDSEW